VGKNSIAVKDGGQWHVNNGPAGVKRLTAVSGGYDRTNDKLYIYAMSGKGYFNPDGDASGIHVTNDGGLTWSNVQGGLLQYQVPGAGPSEFRAIATSENHPARLLLNELPTSQSLATGGFWDILARARHFQLFL
jgi:hypothetical protein